MEVNKYMVFLEVARQQNLSKAAEALGYTQSGISHTLKRMEQDMELTLFDRNRNGAFLTKAGRELLPFITQMVQCQENLSQAIQSLHNLHRGSLVIGTYSSIARRWLPHIIRQFKQDYPYIRIDFKEGGNEDIIRWINQGEVDLGFLSGCFDEGLEWIPLKEDPLLAVLPEDDTKEKETGDTFPLTAFNGETFIISAPGIDVDIHKTLEKHDIRPDIQYSAKDDFTIIAMVACHLGISILPQLVLESYNSSVRTMPLYPYAKRELGIALPGRGMASPATLKFIEYSKDYVSKTLS
ncbi:MAG: LysR family transcriptional regulator [Eubacterium sp.]|nr:LysR family transcriptional regulator [Eubacterium sp.]